MNTFLPKGHNATVIIVIEVILRQTFVPLYKKQITDLLTASKTAIIKGFKSKNGKSFDAALKFDDNFQVVFDFYAK